ncbi:class I SAM-dependent methyltransferase [Sessilibacter sp. MAH4]
MRAISIDETRVVNKKDILFLDNLARSTIFKIFKRIRVGHLILTEGDRTYTFGQPRQDAEIVAKISVNHGWAYRQALFRGSVGSGEAYMLEGWSSPDPLNVVRLMVRNQHMREAMDHRWGFLNALISRISKFLSRNNIHGSKANISAHYDLSNEFFQLFLDDHMMYSSAVFNDHQSSLEDASVTKMQSVCDALKLTEQDHLLEIGTGWGGMAIYAAKTSGCRVTTTTISQEQYAYARARVEREGLSDRVTVLCQDYRTLEGQYDKIVSIEMIEAVGHKYYPTYFSNCSSLLKENGLMFIQAITIADQRYDKARKSTDFIQQYIFPGGVLPSIEIIAKNIRAHTNMQMVSLTDITGDYVLTLDNWRQRFQKNIHKVRELGFDPMFERMWEYYLFYCQGGFQERVISTVQLVLAKPLAKNF